MNKEDVILQNRIRDLAERCHNNNMYTFSEFLSLSDVSAYYSIEQELRYVVATLYGGHEMCERKILRFGSEEQLGYIEDFPITILCIKPLLAKFSDDLSHRDILGSLMNLGIERNVLGDIFVENNVAYVFCLNSIADYLCENISRIKHTSVICSKVDSVKELKKTEMEEKKIQIQSERIDGVIAKVCNMSRSQCSVLFTDRKVFVNGRLNENSSYILKHEDVVTVRGFGRFIYKGVNGTSKKGKLYGTVMV